MDEKNAVLPLLDILNDCRNPGPIFTERDNCGRSKEKFFAEQFKQKKIFNARKFLKSNNEVLP